MCMIKAFVCAYSIYVCISYITALRLYSISPDSACLSRQKVVVIINGSVNLFVAV